MKSYLFFLIYRDAHFRYDILCVSKRGERDVRRTLKVNHLEKGSEIKNDSPTIKESIKMGD